jgi:hypothetical protein
MTSSIWDVAASCFAPFGFDPTALLRDAAAGRGIHLCSGRVACRWRGSRRIPYVAALLDAKLTLSLYGITGTGFERQPSRGDTRADVLARPLPEQGFAFAWCADQPRRPSMRSIEVPAARGCMLDEDTAKAPEFFGPSGRRWYFQSIAEMAESARRLLQDAATRNDWPTRRILDPRGGWLSGSSAHDACPANARDQSRRILGGRKMLFDSSLQTALVGLFATAFALPALAEGCGPVSC